MVGIYKGCKKSITNLLLLCVWVCCRFYLCCFSCFGQMKTSLSSVFVQMWFPYGIRRFNPNQFFPKKTELKLPILSKRALFEHWLCSWPAWKQKKTLRNSLILLSLSLSQIDVIRFLHSNIEYVIIRALLLQRVKYDHYDLHVKSINVWFGFWFTLKYLADTYGNVSCIFLFVFFFGFFFYFCVLIELHVCVVWLKRRYLYL